VSRSCSPLPDFIWPPGAQSTGEHTDGAAAGALITLALQQVLQSSVSCTVPALLETAAPSPVAPSSQDEYLILHYLQMNLVTALERNVLCCGCRGSSAMHCQKYSDTVLKR